MTHLAPAYAGISVADQAVETAIAVAGTAVQVTVFDTNSPYNRLTPDHTNDHITVDVAGDYFITVSATASAAWGGQTLMSTEHVRQSSAIDPASLRPYFSARSRVCPLRPSEAQ